MNKLTNIIKKLEARIEARKVKNPTINFEVLMNIVFNVAKDNDVLDLCIVNIITYLCKKYNISYNINDIFNIMTYYYFLIYHTNLKDNFSHFYKIIQKLDIYLDKNIYIFYNTLKHFITNVNNFDYRGKFNVYEYISQFFHLLLNLNLLNSIFQFKTDSGTYECFDFYSLILHKENNFKLKTDELMQLEKLIKKYQYYSYEKLIWYSLIYRATLRGPSINLGALV